MENNSTKNEIQNVEKAVVTKATIKRDMLNMAMKQAQFYAASTIVPKDYQQNPSNCFIAIEMAERMGADPFQVMQSLNVIQGRPAWSSQFIIAAVNQSGRFKTQLNYRITGKWPNDDFSCVAYATSLDGTLCESIPITHSMAVAEGWLNKNGSKWKTMPELMARYRAASFFGKQFCPDLLLGLMSAEEQREVIDAEAEVVSKEYQFNSTQEVNKEQVKEEPVKVSPEGEVLEDESPKQEPKQEEQPKEQPKQEEDGNLFSQFGA